MTLTATLVAPGSSTSAGLTAALFTAEAHRSYSLTGYALQYDSLKSNQRNVSDYSNKRNLTSTYTNIQPSNKTAQIYYNLNYRRVNRIIDRNINLANFYYNNHPYYLMYNSTTVMKPYNGGV